MRLARKLMIGVLATIAAVFTVRGIMRVRREVAGAEANLRARHALLGRAMRAATFEIWRNEGRDRALALLRSTDSGVAGIDVRWVSWRPPTGIVHVEAADRLMTYVPLADDGSVPGALEVSESLDRLHTELRERSADVVWTSLFAAGAAIAALAILGYTMVGRPLRLLAEKARRIGSGDLSGPLLIRQDDEVGELAREMNQMCERLTDALARIQTESDARQSTVEQLRHAERLTTVGKLASGIAHELGTPLNIVAGRAKMIATAEVTGEQAHESARTIADQAAKMTNIIRQLLEFARRREPRKMPCDLADLCGKTRELLSPMAQRKGVGLLIAAPEGQTRIDGDAAQLQQVLTNLVVNAIHAMPKGGSVVLSAGTRPAVAPPDRGQRIGPCAFVAVRDEGTGIAPDVLPRVFEPFFTTKDIGEGTGLGLSVAYGIVRDHGGWIDIESAVGAGSTFTVYLPRYEMEKAA
jgi:signal transduction histidine kinase